VINACGWILELRLECKVMLVDCPNILGKSVPFLPADEALADSRAQKGERNPPRSYARQIAQRLVRFWRRRRRETKIARIALVFWLPPYLTTLARRFSIVRSALSTGRTCRFGLNSPRRRMAASRSAGAIYHIGSASAPALDRLKDLEGRFAAGLFAIG